MRLGVLLAVCTLGLVLALCPENPNGTCVAPEFSTCITECARRLSNATCSAQSGCSWNSTSYRCFDVPLQATCSNKTNSTDCAGVTGCYWLTQTCQEKASCWTSNSSHPISCFDAPNATDCEARGSHCSYRTNCRDVPKCSLPETQSTCTATSGCFWVEITATSLNYTNAGGCMACSLDPYGHNAFFFYHDALDLSCRVNNISFIATKAVAAATGCEGGFPQFSRDEFLQICTNTTTTGNSSSSSAACFGLTVISAFATFLFF